MKDLYAEWKMMKEYCNNLVSSIWDVLIFYLFIDIWNIKFNRKGAMFFFFFFNANVKFKLIMSGTPRVERLALDFNVVSPSNEVLPFGRRLSSFLILNLVGKILGALRALFPSYSFLTSYNIYISTTFLLISRYIYISTNHGNMHTNMVSTE